jgi:hypothetical protein
MPVKNEVVRRASLSENGDESYWSKALVKVVVVVRIRIAEADARSRRSCEWRSATDH